MPSEKRVADLEPIPSQAKSPQGAQVASVKNSVL